MKITKIFFYPEDKIAIPFSVIILITQFYYYFTGFLKDFSKILFPLISFLLLLVLIYLQSINYTNTSSKFGKFLKFIRSYYHILYYAIIFNAFQTFVHRLNPNDYDTLLLNADIWLFGVDPTLWFQSYASGFLTEIFALSYASYYLLPSITFFMLYTLKGNDSFLITRNYLLAYAIGLYAAIIIYLILPVAGPDMAFPQHYTAPLYGLTPFSTAFLKNLSAYLRETDARNTFPSMHFGVLIMINYFAFLYRRKYFWFCTLPLAILLGIATVYLRQHYFIDLLGSVPIAILSIYLALRINRKYQTEK